MFNFILDPSQTQRGREVGEDLNKIRHLYSHTLIYQGQYATADELLLDLESSEVDPRGKIGPLRTLAHSKRKQKDFPAAKEALTSAWRIMETHGFESSSRGALILEKLAELSEDTSDLSTAEAYLFQALHIQKGFEGADAAALRRRVARLDRVLRQQKRYSVCEELHEEYPQVSGRSSF